MKTLICKMIDHPFASTWIIGSVCSGVASIIRAAKGVTGESVVNVNMNSSKEEN